MLQCHNVCVLNIKLVLVTQKPKCKGFAPSGSGLGKKPKKPKVVNDTGHSSSYAEILGAISEGPVEGILGGLQGVYLDETPVQNSDGSSNFEGFSWDFRNGTQFQTRIPGFSDQITSETNVGAEVKNLLPLTRNIINKNLDGITIRLGFVLQEFPDDGGVRGLSINFKIYIKEGAGAFVLRLDQTLKERYSSLTELEWFFPVTNAGGTVDQFQVRVERVTPQDTDESRYQRQLTWRTYVEVIETKLRYPNTALVGLKFDASQFDNVPQMAFKLAGRTVQIPVNGDIQPDRGINYGGIWNGTFKQPIAATSDPVWIFWDLLTNARYGLGRYLNLGNLDRYSFYELSQYCNQLIPDGFGGTERRFSCNVVIEGKEDAYKVIEAFRSIFRGFTYYLNGAIYLTSDRPSEPVMQFTQADVEDGMFSYSRSSLKARHTVALVTYIDPGDFYRRTVEVVEDPEGISLYGVKTLEISAFACTTRGQARRAGLAALLTERLETDTVTFKVRSYGVYARPGMTIRIADSKRAEVRNGGLIAASTTTTVTLDAPVKLEAGQLYKIACMLPDGQVQERTVVNAPGTYVTILPDTPFLYAPQVEGNWLIFSTQIDAQMFRILNVAPVPGSDYSMYEITALQYEAGKYGAVELGWTLPPRQTRITVPSVVSPPRNVRGAVRFVTVGVATQIVLDALWDYPVGADGNRDQFVTSYLVEVKRGEFGEWGATQSQQATSLEFTGLTEGEVYYIRVASVDVTGAASVWVESPAVFLGYTMSIARFDRPLTSFFAGDF